MGRLMKAEWYRLKHSSGLFKLVIAIGIVSVAFIYLTELDIDLDVSKYSLAEHLNESTEMYFFIIYCLAVISAVIIGTSYTNKLAYYEVMAGNKISAILLSKVLVSAVFLTVVYSVFLDLYWAVIGMSNGVGEITQLSLRFILLAVVFFHVCSTSIFMATAIQHTAGAVFSYLRFSGFDILLVFCIELFGNFSQEINTKISDWFVMFELSTVLRCEAKITNHLVFASVFGMLIEAVIWYVISYVRMKKKLYN